MNYRETSNQDPFPFYERIKEQGPVYWDESVSGWLVTSFRDCAQVLQNEELFNRADRYVAGGEEVRGGWRNLATLGGQDHRRLHNMLLSIINPRRSEKYRTTVIRPIADELISRFAHKGEAELTEVFSDQLPLRVGCTLLGLDVSDEFIERIRELRVPITYWMDTMTEDPEAIGAASRAINEIRDIFMPTILDRKTNPRDDLISEIWKLGPTVFEDWNEKDTFSSCLSNYSGGESTYLLRNMIYGVLTQPGLQDHLLSDPDTYIPRYVEEALRYMGVVHWQIRIATADVELGGKAIKSGDRLFAMIAPANRDEDHFECPHQMNLEKRPPKDHLGFGRGPRYCPGAPLAKVELHEALFRLLKALPELRLDENAEPPHLVGWHVRTYKPLHARFSV